MGAAPTPETASTQAVSDTETHDLSQDWTKLRQAEAPHAIRRHDGYLRRISGGQRALSMFHDLSELNLAKAGLREAELIGVKFRNIVLDGAELRDANLGGTVLAK